MLETETEIDEVAYERRENELNENTDPCGQISNDSQITLRRSPRLKKRKVLTSEP